MKTTSATETVEEGRQWAWKWHEIKLLKSKALK